MNALDFYHKTSVEVATNYFKKFNNVISFLAESSEDGIFEKLFNTKHERIRDRFYVFQGVVTGNNPAYIISKEQAKAANIEPELLKPVLHGRDFERWLVRSDERLILYVNADTPLKRFPNTAKWLQQFRPELKTRRECIRGVIPWFSLQWPRDVSLLDRKEKIAATIRR